MKKLRLREEKKPSAPKQVALGVVSPDLSK
jgi:hypothetical protein